MPEPTDPRLTGLDGARPLPDALRSRLERALGAPAMPVAVREGIEDALADDAPSPFTAEIDAPRSLPPAMVDRLVGAIVLGTGTAAEERARPGGAVATLVRSARRLPTAAWLATAAAIAVALVGIGMLATPTDRGGDVVAGPELERPTTIPALLAGPEPDAVEAPTGSSVSPLPAPAAVSTSPKTQSSGSTSSRAARRPTRPRSAPSAGKTRSEARSDDAQSSAAGPSTTSAPAGGGGASSPPPAAAAPSRSAPQSGAGQPPFTGGIDSSGDTKSGAAAPSSNEAIRVAVVEGDDRQERGFKAYVELLNRRGGVGGRALSIVAPGTAGAVATVNLGAEPLASAPAGPLLETLTADESALRGEVLSFASPAERQAHLAVDAVYPGEVPPGTNAIVVRGATGAFKGPIADAFAGALRAKGVLVTTVDATSSMPAADGAFLSLTTAEARRWLERARADGYAPRALAGIWSLHDPALESLLPASAKVLSPYALPTGEEAAAIRDATSVSAASLHGWVTAKALALALWRSGATTPSATSAALRDLTGVDLRLIPPYQVRPGTRSRTPEAVLLEAREGAFTQTGGFRRDPR